MVAFSCFGALNGVILFSLHAMGPNSGIRLLLHRRTFDLRCGQGRVSTRVVWAVAPNQEDPPECNASSSKHHDHLHTSWWWLPFTYQFRRRSLLGVLFSHRTSVTWCLYQGLKFSKVLGLVILRIKEPTLERYRSSPSVKENPVTWLVDHIKRGSRHP